MNTTIDFGQYAGKFNLQDLFHQLPSTFLGSLFLIFCFLWPLSRVGRREADLPPGPKTIPILGNIHQIPANGLHRWFKSLSDQYGPIISLKLGNKTTIVLSDITMVKDLIENRSNIYSSRPENYLGEEITDRNHIIVTPYNDYWRALRKAMHHFFTQKSVEAHLPLQEAEAAEMLMQIVDNPDNFFNAIRRYSTAVAVAALYGKRCPTWDSPEVVQIYDVMDRWTALLEVGATPPINEYKFLRYFPTFLAPWKVKMREVKRDMRKLHYGLLEECKIRRAAGIYRESFAEACLEAQKDSGLNDDNLAWLMGSLLEAGSDTTSSTVLGFVLAIMKFPDQQRKAQEEIDRIVGRERMPVTADRENLPFIRACVFESQRWRPIAAAGIPRRVDQTDSYAGYRIPKGSTVIYNTWALHMDEKYYGSKTEEFRAERFLEGNKNIPENSARLPHFNFGSGRRMCTGLHLANNSLFLNLARLLWAFDITSPTGFIDVAPETAFSKGFLVGPLPFQAIFRLRSPELLPIMEHERMNAQHNVFSQYS